MSLHLLVIDNDLKKLLHRLESHLSVDFDKTIVNKIFLDFENYSQYDTEKHYTLYKSQSLWFPGEIEGIVDAYESETIWLQSQNGFRQQERFDAFFKNRP